MAAFFEDRCLQDPDAAPVSKDDAYEAHAACCRGRGLTSLAKNVFVRETGRVAPFARQIQRSLGVAWVRCWEGFVLVPYDEEEG